MAFRLPVLPIVLTLCLPIAQAQQASPAPALSPDGLYSEPVLRLNPQGHFATIKRIDSDAEGRWLVSGSSDKTVKIWRMQDGQLERTIHLPQGPGHFGKVFAVAISPDGAQVAAGGWTGSPLATNTSIYILDRATGKLLHRIKDLPTPSTHLHYSHDGRRFAVALGGSGGLRLYNTEDYLEITRDGDYGARTNWLDFATDGRLVTSSSDGKLRLYRADGTRQLAVSAHPERRPFGVAFSPDGNAIAVAYEEAPRVEVWDSQRLQKRYSADTGGIEGESLERVAWSADGQSLLAGGQYLAAVWSPLRRWSKKGLGQHQDLRIAAGGVKTLLPLHNGHLLIAAGDTIALWNAADETIWEHANGTAEFRGQVHDLGLRLSTSGDRLFFHFGRYGTGPALFSLRDFTLSTQHKAPGELGLPDEGPREGLSITDWEDDKAPKVNGRPLRKNKAEPTQSLAISPDGERFVVGGGWTLNAYHRSGHILWHQAAPDTAWTVNITADGRYAVAGFGDGTLRWHRMTDGEELMAFYPHPDGLRWVLWTPQGYYQASAGGEDLIGWLINRGNERMAEFFPASRFRDRYYRPDVIARVLKTGDPAEALRLADAERGSRNPDRVVSGNSRSLSELLPPTIEILSPASGSRVKNRRLSLLYHARSENSPIIHVEARVNTRPAKILQNNPPDTDRDGKEWAGQLAIEIPPEDVTVELIAYNRHGAGEAARFHVNWSGGEDYYKPELWILGVGISDHPVRKARLKWAARDARDLVNLLESQEGGLYKKVHYRLLTDREATRDAIREHLDWLSRESKPRDVAMVFLAGHGFRDSYEQDYYFLPYDGTPEKAVLSSVSGDDFRRFLRTVEAKTVVFLDTCYSGGLRTGRGVPDSRPDVTRFANELADAESGITVFASSTGRQLSVERDEWQNGAFTEALLEALKGSADYTGDSFLRITELETYLAERVNELTGGNQKPVTTKPKAQEDYRLLRVVGR